MNTTYRGNRPVLEEHDALLMDVARRVQLTRTMHETADTNFRALCQYVDRKGSPLEGLVLECYPSGSFAIGSAIVSQLTKNQHDVDVVIELDIPLNTHPKVALDLLFEAVNGGVDGRYRGKVRRNSRCVTVKYEDGTTVDLMPVARIIGPNRAGVLFHHKSEDAYFKAVNPWGFADHFNLHIEYNPTFRDLFIGRRLLVEGAYDERAATQPLPGHVPLEEKSPRVAAIQLIKRARDIAHRSASRQGFKKPPSVVLAAIALETGLVQASLLDEVVAVANAIRRRLSETSGPRGTVHVSNPSYAPDVFTDRWPENKSRADLFDGDLRRLIVALHKLKNEGERMSLAEKQELLKGVFGETAASYAINSQLSVRDLERKSGRMRLGPTGKVLGSTAAAAAGASSSAAARVGTREGGRSLPE